MSYFPSAHGIPGQTAYYTYGAPGYEPGTPATSQGAIGGHGEHVNELQANEAYEDSGHFARGNKPSAYGQSYPPVPEYSQTISAAQGTAGFLYATQSPSVAPAAPLQPYSTEQSRSGYVRAPPTGGPYTQAEMQAFNYGQSQRTGEHPLSRAQAAFTPRGYSDGSLYNPNPQIVPSHGPREMTSSLAGALGPPSASTPTARIETPHRSNTLPHPDMGLSISSPSSDYPYSEYGSPYAEEVDFQFVVETGSPASVASARSARGRTDPDSAEDVPRKRTTSKAPKKEQGFLACYFCRGRKIACNAPPKDAEDRSCEQCLKRKIPCEYPTISRRGQRNLDGKKKAQSVDQYAPSRVRTDAHQAMQGPASGYPYGN